MPRTKKPSSEFNIKKLDLREAQRQFNRKRGRGSKYDEILEEIEKLDEGKALIVEQISYSEVTGLRQRVKNLLGADDWKIEATNVNKDKNLYDLLIHRNK